ncbi:prolyl 4-hydroxylase subunit alpha-1-like [Pyrus ussuriensis x Pyrus communis]|uniref:Prolyl 4-hydroxylase subunit alpha-1-like n=1 Tax=Pyrus ussuriensis x Pyrus communis TaxID=2448454 RepID=A0A5N5FI29_9ROSA|nr:prolyl 4-hydroxylase subunit alpha-1-like [Pyrus ussuriensis x Pyrus communis]
MKKKKKKNPTYISFCTKVVCSFFSFLSNISLPSTSLVPPLFFFTGLFISTLLSHASVSLFLSGSRPVSRTLESEDDEDHGPILQGDTGDSFIPSIPFQVLSWTPRVLYFPRFATAEQCERVIEMAKMKLGPSTLALRKGETAESTKGTRTRELFSARYINCQFILDYISGTFISASEDDSGVLDVIEEKIARATILPRTHGEFASFLLYLSNVEEGGETMFPFENGAEMGLSYDYKKCIGLKIMPKQGDGLLFYSVFRNGTIDPTSLHGSCPVSKGSMIGCCLNCRMP